MAEKKIRRSVVLPESLVQEAQQAAPELRGNFNQLVVASLLAWLQYRKRESFRSEMLKMAQDPSIQRECARISQEFFCSDADGLE